MTQQDTQRAAFEAWYAGRHETYDTAFIYYTPENRYQRPIVDESWSAYQAGRAALKAQNADAGLDVEAVLRRFLTGDGFIAECDITHIVAALTAQPAINGYTCTVPDDCETLRWRGQILSMNELASMAQPAVGEEIHVHIEGQDVLTLPLASSGMNAPRFVVHVPAQADQARHQGEKHDNQD